MSATTAQLSGNVELVAAGTEELGSSIRQMSEDADRAARLGTQAVDRVQGANTTVTELGDSSARIGQVLNLITSIAEQTNLLALNATIEAARAGEAGSGTDGVGASRRPSTGQRGQVDWAQSQLGSWSMRVSTQSLPSTAVLPQ
jgi:methyl-accepting chemotaxis protein